MIDVKLVGKLIGMKNEDNNTQIKINVATAITIIVLVLKLNEYLIMNLILLNSWINKIINNISN